MAHGLNSVIKRDVGAVQCKPEGKTGVGSRRIFSPQFKLQVLDSYRNDADCKGNQRATARKYGIHRRQIQKWLQVEGTLRSGVSGKHQLSVQTVKSEMSLNGHRQRDDESSALRSASLASEARVPAMEPPTGWQTHQMAPMCPADPGAPIDLSLKRPVAPPLNSPPAAAHFPVLGPTPSLPTLRQPDVWDLSTKSNKRKADTESATAKPVKLFKPYLDDVREISNSSPSISSTSVRVTPPPLSQSMYGYHSSSTRSPELYYNNNNLSCDAIKSEYQPSCTFHELKGAETSLLCHPYYTDLSPKYHISERYHPELSPNYHPYEEPLIYTQMKHRQSFSLDLELSAIDCCTHDSLCKGNPRAVIMKYNSPKSDDLKWTTHYELRPTSEMKGEIKVEY